MARTITKGEVDQEVLAGLIQNAADYVEVLEELERTDAEITRLRSKRESLRNNQAHLRQVLRDSVDRHKKQIYIPVDKVKVVMVHWREEGDPTVNVGDLICPP